MRAQLGNWVKKPIEQDMFEVDIWLNRSNSDISNNQITQYLVPRAK